MSGSEQRSPSDLGLLPDTSGCSDQSAADAQSWMQVLKDEGISYLGDAPPQPPTHKSTAASIPRNIRLKKVFINF